MLGEVTRRLGARWQECFFFATHAGGELDLMVVRGRRRIGFEFKRTDSPKLTPFLRSALATLRLERILVVHAGAHSFPLDDRIRAVAASALLSELRPLR